MKGVEELYNVGKYILDLPNVGRTKEEIFDYIKDAENLLIEDFKVQISKTNPIFLVVDEFAALRILWIRKNLMKSMIV